MKDTTNTMPMLTDSEREELISDIRHCRGNYSSTEMMGRVLDIALACLTAEKSTLGEIESGIRALKMTLTKCNRMNYCRGVLMNLDDVVAKAKECNYTAPPVPVLKAIDLSNCTLTLNGREELCMVESEVIAAIRADGYEVKE